MLKYIASALLGAAIVFFLMRGCGDVHTGDIQIKKDSVNAIIDTLNNRHTADSMQHILDVRANDSMRQYYEGRLSNITTKATNQIVKLTFERNKFSTQMEGRDTVSAISTCERFIFLYDSALVIVAQYKAAVDSIQSNGADRRSIDSAATVRQETLIGDYKAQIDALNHFLTESLKESADLRTALAKSKRGKWLLAAAGFLVGGFLGHSIK